MTLVRRIKAGAGLIVGARGSAIETARGRLVFMGFCFMGLFAVVILRVSFLCLWQEGAEPRFDMSHNNAAQTLAAGRADITDRNGELLATSLETMSLYADPKLITDPIAVTADLKTIFPDMNEFETSKKLGGAGRFVWVERGLTPREVAAVNALGYPGLNFRQETRRFYPQERLFAHMIGYTDLDGSGLSGIERAFDATLKKSTAPVQLTIDVRFQHALRRAMLAAIHDFTAIGGAGLIMDVQSGEILAAVSLPDFDPHHAGAALPDERFNRFALGVYEMGSTFKSFSIAAYLEHVSSDLNKRFDASKPLVRNSRRISDFKPQKRKLNIPEIFIHSSNIGTALMAEELGTDPLKKFYADLGFMDVVSVDLNERGRPLVPNPWRNLDTMTASYGHSIAVTPLHTIRAFSAIVNGGTLPHLHLIKGEVDKVRPRIISESVSRTMRDLLRMTVMEGTASKADVSGARVGAKTGTSEKNQAGGYSGDRLLSSIIATYPVDHPRYAILISIDEPKPNATSYGYATAGYVAAPAAGAVVKALMSIENMEAQPDTADNDLKSEMVHYFKEDDKVLKKLAAHTQ